MNDIVTEARAWLGTPYHHQASVKQVGCDCLGLVRGVWRGVRGDEPEIMPAYTKEWAEVHGAESLLEAARRHLVEKFPHPVFDHLLPGGEGITAGDVLLFRMRPSAVVKHAGIYVGEGKFIHAYEHAGVVEAEFSEFWQRKIAGVFGWG